MDGAGREGSNNVVDGDLVDKGWLVENLTRRNYVEARK